ncbi:MAG: hypothetical protein BMS9Abin01_2753 [Gammaproteobacteria bacterium]|nr:MAG: hypothetical protein BMS9Abin01_2753 [Gammaproteobacteria bacterium]
MASNKSTRKAVDSASRRARAKPARSKRRHRRRRLTDKIRAALARAAALGRHDVTEQLGSLYQARVEEELGRGRQRRARDSDAPKRRTRRSH